MEGFGGFRVELEAGFFESGSESESFVMVRRFDGRKRGRGREHIWREREREREEEANSVSDSLNKSATDSLSRLISCSTMRDTREIDLPLSSY